MLGPSVVDLISPDYNSTTSEVFMAFAKAMIVASMSDPFLPLNRFRPLSDGPAVIRLTAIGKTTTLKSSNNAPGPQMGCPRGYLIGQT